MAEAPSSPARLDIGPVSLAVASGWNFFPLEDRVVGRPVSGVGGIQIVRLAADVVPWPASHEICMAAALKASQQIVEGPGFDRAREYSDRALAGGESFRNGPDFLRVWYRHCPDGMIAAWFGVRQKRAGEKSVRTSIRQCDQMIATLRVPPPLA
jgi:hypothetical protein